MKIFRMYVLLNKYSAVVKNINCDAVIDYCDEIKRRFGEYPWHEEVKDVNLPPITYDYWMNVLYLDSEDYDPDTGNRTSNPLDLLINNESISDQCASVACGWTSLDKRDYLLSDRDMMFFAIGAMNMSQSPADVAFWGFVHDSCSFGE